MLIRDLIQLTQTEIQDFIFVHEGDDEKKLILTRKEILGVSTSMLAQQISGRRKAKTKLPTWYKTRNIIYPISLNLEQCSSEATAQFRGEAIKNLLIERRKVVDLTGGLGVDSFFLENYFSETVYVEPDQSVLEIAKHNNKLLGSNGVAYINQKAEEFLKTNKTSVSLFYIDPSRRSKTATKLFKLMDCAPDITSLQAVMFEQAEFVLLKASPLLDIQQGLREIKNVKKVWVLSVENECKELLFLAQKNFTTEPEIEAVNLNLMGGVLNTFSFRLSEERESKLIEGILAENLYEPNASILKAGAFKLVAKRFDLQKIQMNTHLYTSHKLILDFPGRVFKIEKINPDSKEMRKSLPQGKANVATRNYPLSADELKRKLKLKDGGEKFVIGFSEQKRKTIVIAERIK